jgi:DNA-binding response OmpR family regulator
VNRKVLVVDDEAPIRRILARALGRAGISVVEAASAEEGLETLHRESIPVMFLDLMLPGMDGCELCRRIREDNPLAIISAITGQSSLFELTDCREAGFDDYFRKPFSLEEVTAAAQAAFARLERWRRH